MTFYIINQSVNQSFVLSFFLPFFLCAVFNQARIGLDIVGKNGKMPRAYDVEEANERCLQISWTYVSQSVSILPRDAL